MRVADLSQCWTDKPKLKVKMQSVSDDDVRKCYMLLPLCWPCVTSSVICPLSDATHEIVSCFWASCKQHYSKYSTFTFTFYGLIKLEIMTSRIKGSVTYFTCTWTFVRTFVNIERSFWGAVINGTRTSSRELSQLRKCSEKVGCRCVPVVYLYLHDFVSYL